MLSNSSASNTTTTTTTTGSRFTTTTTTSTTTPPPPNLIESSPVDRSLPKIDLYTKVYFRVEFNTEISEKIIVVGSDKHLGAWDPQHAHELITTDELHPSWFSPSPVYLPLKSIVYYKYAIYDHANKQIRWETPLVHTDGGGSSNNNRTIVPTGMEMTVEDDNGRYRQQTISPMELLGDQRRSTIHACTDKKARDELEAQNTVARLHAQEAEPVLDENDTLVVCAFELPIKVTRKQGGGFEVHPGKSALLPTLHQLRGRTKVPAKFVGYAGITVDDEQEASQIESVLESYDCVPVFPPVDQLNMFLEFSHRFLWPLFHNVVQLDSRRQEPFSSDHWSCYQAMNKLWADVLLRNAHESDLIWVHDFQLLLLPLYIARRFRRANIGLFLHVPFPSSEVFRCLPVREEIMRGMLSADLIGFHFFEYARHFLVACKRLLGIHYHFRMGGFLGMEYSGRNVVIRIGHVHIQAEDLLARLDAEPFRSVVREKAQQIRDRFAGRYIFCSVDRCDRLSGLLLKMRAFHYFLNNYSYAQSKAVLIQYAYPSISYWDDASEMRNELTEMVNKVNRDLEEEPETSSHKRMNNQAHSCGSCKHIDLHVSEIDYVDKLALFYAADCFLDTAIKDGLNLNPFEFLCCHHERPASIILSEFTGCSKALASAKRCNPWKSENVAEQMDICMRSSAEALRDRFLRDQAYVQHNSTLKWAEEFVLDLRRARKPEDMVFMPCGFGNTFRVMGMDCHFRPLDTHSVVEALKLSRNRVFFLDYEGTLAPDKRRITAFYTADSLFSQGTAPSAVVKSCLRHLLVDHKNVVVILSGRDTSLLEMWFGDIPGIGLCGEHGFRYKVPVITGDQWQSMLPATSVSDRYINTWRQIALELMMQYVKRTQGSFVENKGSALVFQYRDADPDFGAMQAKELSNYLSEILFGYPVTVVTGKGYVEAKLHGVNKGNAVRRIIKQLVPIRGEVDFILCIGDDRSDEDMFAVIAAMTEEDAQKQKLSYPNNPTSPSTSPRTNRVVTGQSDSSGAGAKGAGLGSGGLASLDSGLSLRGSIVTGLNALANVRDDDSALVSEHARRSSVPSVPQSGHGPSERFFTCTVGKKPTKARYYLNDTDDVSELLEAIRAYVDKTSTGHASVRHMVTPPMVPRPHFDTFEAHPTLGASPSLIHHASSSFVPILPLLGEQQTEKEQRRSPSSNHHPDCL